MLYIEKSFIALLWLSCLVLTAVIGLAWWAPSWLGLQGHVVAGSIGTLLGLFAHVSTLFYFIGTSVWIRDRSHELMHSDKDAAMRVWSYYQKANRLKSYAMPCPTLGIFAGLFGFIFGGATHVGALAPWIHESVALSFFALSWAGLILARKALKKNIEYLDLTSKELDSQNTQSEA